MPVHLQVLEQANRIALQNKDRSFGAEEVVRALPHLNPSTVRTHVVSRCCTNAPRNHTHKWDYFRRVSRGRYQVLPPYRQTPAAQSSPRAVQRVARRGDDVARRSDPGFRRDTIHAVVRKDEAVYVAECLEVAVVTQGGTLDEVVQNLQHAVTLHLEGEDLAALGVAEHPRLQLTCDLPLAP